MESKHNQEQPRNATADHFVGMGFTLFYTEGFNQAIECFDKAIQVGPAIHVDSSRGAYL